MSTPNPLNTATAVGTTTAMAADLAKSSKNPSTASPINSTQLQPSNPPLLL